MQHQLEHFFARLLTDADFRERFLADPAAVASEAGLSPAECDAAAKLSAEDLRTAARSFAHKRAGKLAASGRAAAGWFRARSR